MLSEPRRRGMPLKVVYILGLGRSGTTLLNLLLGEIDGFFAVGELQSLWKEAIIDGRLCGCGQPVRDCPLWNDVLERAHLPPPTHLVEMQQRMRIHGVARRRSRKDAAAARSYAEALGRIYGEVAHMTAARTIVDSSKLPTIAPLLKLVPNIQPYLVQLVRDPRAVAFSWGRTKPATDRLRAQRMERFSPATTARLWASRQIASEVVRWRSGSPTFLTRYEDLVSHPKSVVRAIVNLIDEAADIDFIRGRRVVLSANHTVSGNPIRLSLGVTDIQEDRQWVMEMGRSAFTTVTSMTLPLLLRYGYPVARETPRPWDASQQRHLRNFTEW